MNERRRNDRAGKRRLFALAVVAIALGAVLLPSPASSADAVCAAPPAATIFAAPGVVTIGTAGPDVIYGTGGDDRIAGLAGNDIILGFGGNDQLAGGDGNDILCGGAGNDDLAGGLGEDRLFGESGDDRLSGGEGTDLCDTGGQVGDAAAPPPSCESILTTSTTSSTTTTTSTSTTSTSTTTTTMATTTTSSTTTTKVNQPPAVNAPAGTVSWAEGALPVVVAPALTVTDPDSQIAGATATITNPVAGDRLGWTDDPGDSIVAIGVNSTTITFTGTGTPAQYQAALRAVTYSSSSDNPTNSTRTVSFRVTDSSGAQSPDIAASRRGVNVTPVNDAPVVDAHNQVVAWAEGGTAITLAPTLTVGDPDSQISGATVTILNPVPGDELGWVDNNPDINAIGAGTLTITFTGTATTSSYEAALRDVTFRSTSADPKSTVRTVSFRVTDTSGAQSADTAESRVNVEVTPSP